MVVAVCLEMPITPLAHKVSKGALVTGGLGFVVVFLSYPAANTEMITCLLCLLK